MPHATPIEVKTPQTTSRLRPPTSEMHPSKAHASTAKKPNSALKLGFSDFNSELETPTKSTSKRGPLTSNPPMVGGTVSSPTFNFAFNRPDSELGPEAQRIMESVRGEAERIKSQMKKEEEQQKERDKEAEHMFGVGNRKIAGARARGGRFSDVHKRQFGKMDSIADHPSAWKNKFTSGGNPSTLKRTTSKAGFDEEPERYTNFSRPTSSGRIENSAPGKRMRKTANDDVSSARPISRDDAPGSSIPTPSSTGPKLPSVMTTPTKASLARATSVKNLSASKLPTLPRSKSMKTLSSPLKGLAQYPDGRPSETKKFLSSLPRFGSSIKSILHKPHPKYSNDPEKIAAGTHIQSPSGIDENAKEKDFPFPDAPHHVPATTAPSSPYKRVNFSASTKTVESLADDFPPSPSKIPSLSRARTGNMEVSSSASIDYPSLPLSSSKSTADDAKPGDFTFRTSHPGEPVSFTSPTSGLNQTRTIRAVRPSGIATPLAPFENMPTVPHGINNKKRRRTEAEDDDMLENIEPGGDDGNGIEEEGPQKKKVKSKTMPPPKVNASPSKIGKPVAAAAKGKGFLSRARLSALARPKERR